MPENRSFADRSSSAGDSITNSTIELIIYSIECWNGTTLLLSDVIGQPAREFILIRFNSWFALTQLIVCPSPYSLSFYFLFSYSSFAHHLFSPITRLFLTYSSPIPRLFLAYSSTSCNYKFRKLPS